MDIVCPICKGTNHVEVDLHSEGYAADIFECTDCDTLWSSNDGIITILKETE